MKPKIRYMKINGQPEALTNASGIVEVARSADTDPARRFLAAYHTAEAEIAAHHPAMPEEKIRNQAVIDALRSLGAHFVEI